MGQGLFPTPNQGPGGPLMTYWVCLQVTLEARVMSKKTHTPYPPEGLGRDGEVLGRPIRSDMAQAGSRTPLDTVWPPGPARVESGPLRTAELSLSVWISQEAGNPWWPHPLHLP